MSYPKTFISYAVMGDEIGSNPMGHACLIFSKQESPESPLEVMDSYGFYSQASGEKGPPLIRKLKKTCGLDFDLGGTYGRIEEEQLRYLDKNGLKGKTFEISAAQNEALYEKIATRMQEEQECIKKHQQALQDQNRPSNPKEVYLREKEEAKREQRSDVLLPFEVDVNPIDGTKGSHNCKVYIVELLRSVGVNESELDDLFGANSITHALPRFSGKNLEPIQLMSVGPLQRHQSERTGKVTHYRVWHSEDDSKNSRVFWAIPPKKVRNCIGKDGLSPFPVLFENLCFKYVNFLHRLEKKLVFEGPLNDELRELRATEITNLLQEFSLIWHQPLEKAKALLQKTKIYCEKEGPVDPFYSPYLLPVLRYGGYATMALSSLILAMSLRHETKNHALLLGSFGLFSAGSALSLFAWGAPKKPVRLPQIPEEDFFADYVNTLKVQ